MSAQWVGAGAGAGSCFCWRGAGRQLGRGQLSRFRILEVDIDIDINIDIDVKHIAHTAVHKCVHVNILKKITLTIHNNYLVYNIDRTGSTRR